MDDAYAIAAFRVHRGHDVSRGGLEVAIVWENGRLATARIRSTVGGTVRVRIPQGMEVRLGSSRVEPVDGVVIVETQVGDDLHLD